MNWEYREKEMLSSVLRSQEIYPLPPMSGILKMPTKIPSLGKENVSLNLHVVWDFFILKVLILPLSCTNPETL